MLVYISHEYKPGFIHAKSYLADDEYAMIGTINLDYRSLVHHFENGVWMYRCESIGDLKHDMEATFEKSIRVTPDVCKNQFDSEIHPCGGPDFCPDAVKKFYINKT
ncbi:MAG: phospholipase D-like domain-containing protein [Clostridia bacterium]